VGISAFRDFVLSRFRDSMNQKAVGAEVAGILVKAICAILILSKPESTSSLRRVHSLNE
jgi:hypothetical protein